MSNVENPNLNALLYIVPEVETGHIIVPLIITDISYPLMITALEFMCSYYRVVFIQNICADSLYSALMLYNQQVILFL